MDNIDFDESLPVIIVGHVDHGKSTFIGRFLFDSNNLTTEKLMELKAAATKEKRKLDFAHVMDQFKEERDNNMTIDTAQTFFKLKNRSFVFIDAPGHKEYLKNMVTGAAQATAAFLLLDITEGEQAQTEMHVRILKLLGITDLAVLINKMDAIQFDKARYQKAVKALTALFKKWQIRPKAFIPISAREGDNVINRSRRTPWYIGLSAFQFVNALRSDKKHQHKERALFPIQMEFSLQKKSYLLGRVEEGVLRAKRDVFIFPLAKKVKLARLKTNKKDLKEARAGTCVAVQLNNQTGLKRGMILSSEPLPTIKEFSAHVFWGGSQSLKPHIPLVAECRTQSASCLPLSITDEISGQPMSELCEGDIGVVHFQNKEPLFLEKGGHAEPFSRLVFQQDKLIVGCGVVKDVD